MTSESGRELNEQSHGTDTMAIEMQPVFRKDKHTTMSIDFIVRPNAQLGSLHAPPRAAASFCKLKLSALLLMLAAVVIFAAPARAQLDTSTISGVVSDRTGAVISGASVVITDTKTNRSVSLTTNSKGEFFAPSLGVSAYRVKFSKRGFRTTTIEGIVLHANDSIAENAVLDVGAVSETVTVQAQQIETDTETSNLGATITADQVSQLPTNGRDIMDMLALVPGAIQNTGSSVNNDSMGGFPSGQMGVNVLMDGGDSTRVDANVQFTTFGLGNARITRSSVDNVQEVKVLSSDYSAEYGRAIGDIINVITKSGSNNLHGEAFEFFRNNALDAKNYFDNSALQGEVPLRLNQFGGNLGGPVFHNKLFYFGNYEGERQRVTNIVSGETLVLNPAMRALAVPAMLPVIADIPLGNAGPANTVNHIIYSYWFDVLNGTTYSDINENTYALKLDYVLSPKNNFAARYNYNASNTYGTYGLAIGQYENGRQLSQLGKVTWNYIGSQSFLNELGFNINSPDSNQNNGEPQFPEWGCFFCTIGLGLTPGPNGMTFGARVPAISYELMDTATKIKGRNQFRFGADIRWNNVGRELVTQDSITYFGGPTVEAATNLPCNGQPQGTNGCIDPGNGPEDFLANNGEGWSVLGYPMTHMLNTMMGYFFNDDMKLRHNLSINLGIRYEYNTVLHDSKGALENFNVAALSLDKPGTQLYAPSRVDWAPRLGFNWDPYGKGLTALKGGLGLFFLPISPGGPLNIAINTEQNASLNLLSEWFNGVSCTPSISSVSFPLPTSMPVCTPQTPISVTAFDPHERDSYSEQWSLAVDQQIAKNTVFTLAYRGNHGLRLSAGPNLNLAEPNCPAGETVGPNCPGGTAPISGQSLNYDLSNLWGSVSDNGQFASSNYNALNAAIRTNTHGLNLQANYNWSHEFDDFMGLFEAYQNPYNIKADWSQGDIDVRDTFAIGGFYNAPKIPIRFTRLGTGWQITTIVQGRTGTPVNFGVSNVYDPASSSLRPDCVPGVSWKAQNWSHNNQFNTAAFSVPKLAYGTCPRNLGRGTNYIQPDFGLVKNTRLAEHLNWEFRGEVFNAPNHPNFSNPGSSINGYAFGSSYSTIGNLVGQGTSRQIQISTKLTF